MNNKINYIKSFYAHFVFFHAFDEVHDDGSKTENEKKEVNING